METALLTQPAYLLSPVTAVHPPDLDTDDSSLATVVLPAPPPLASVSGHRRDTHLKRPAQVFSYLPASDPGSTYSGLMGGLGLSLVPEDESRLRKRPRVDKSAINDRAQRASARNLTPSLSHPLLAPWPPHPSTSSLDDPPLPHLPLSSDPSRDKGKTKEKLQISVKQEPQSVALEGIDQPLPTVHTNDDHCSSCRSNGALVYCDGCPRAFHLWCLDPPLDAQDIPEQRWFCPACVIRQNPPPKPRRSLLGPLLRQLQLSIPAEFELPEDIRLFFKDVATGPKGAYQDSSETRTARSSRFVVQDEREPFRLKDKNGAPVLCFRCGKSALPDSTARRAPPRDAVLWKSIVSCDHCMLHWHLDCLDPPLASMPPAHKKWMCPAHIEHIAPRRRVPRHVPPVTDVTERNRPNNGNIEIIPADNTADKRKKMAVDEIHINGRRYRVPERVIVLDFWDKLRRAREPLHRHGLLSGSSSPLTSLSSLDDVPSPVLCSPQPPEPLSEPPSEPPATPEPDPETMRAVELLFGCRTAVVKDRLEPMEVDSPPRETSEIAIQTEPEGCVKVAVQDVKQLSGLISATPQDRKGPESPPLAQPVPARPASPLSSRRKSNLSGSRLRRPIRPDRHLPDASEPRMTRSKAAPAASSPPQRSKTETSTATVAGTTLTRTTRVTRSVTGSTFIPQSPLRAPSPVESTKSPRSVDITEPAVVVRPSRTPKSATELSKPLVSLLSEPAPVEASGSTAPKSPFKIRIPRAINTAVAAATAAAAAAAAQASSPSATPQAPDRQRSTAYDERTTSPASESDYLPPAAVKLASIEPRLGAKARSKVRPPMDKFAYSQASGSTRSPRRTRGAVAAPRTPSRRRREINPFDRSPHYTELSDSGTSDYIAGAKRPGPGKRANGLEV